MVPEEWGGGKMHAIPLPYRSSLQHATECKSDGVNGRWGRGDAHVDSKGVMVGDVVSLWLDWNGHKAEAARLRTLSPALSLLEAQASGRHQPLDLQVPCVTG